MGIHQDIAEGLQSIAYELEMAEPSMLTVRHLIESVAGGRPVLEVRDGLRQCGFELMTNILPHMRRSSLLLERLRRHLETFLGWGEEQLPNADAACEGIMKASRMMEGYHQQEDSAQWWAPSLSYRITNTLSACSVPRNYELCSELGFNMMEIHRSIGTICRYRGALCRVARLRPRTVYWCTFVLTGEIQEHFVRPHAAVIVRIVRRGIPGIMPRRRQRGVPK